MMRFSFRGPETDRSGKTTYIYIYTWQNINLIFTYTTRYDPIDDIVRRARVK